MCALLLFSTVTTIMNNLQQINGRAHYLPGANNLGIILTGDGGAIAIDTGIDKETGKAIRKALDEVGATLRTIISTHHHADHIGGNDYLVRAYPGVVVCAPPIEAALIAHPELEPIYLSFGAAPVPALKTKWLMAKGVLVNQIIATPTFEIAGVRFDVLALPGHSINQIGVSIDGVCFAADGFFGPTTLGKHGIPYAHEIGGQLASLRLLAKRGDAFFLPGHGALTPHAELADAIAVNVAAVERASQIVLAALAEPGNLIEVAARVQQAFELTFPGLPQYAVFLSAVSAHLAWLESQGLACVEVGAIWKR